MENTLFKDRINNDILNLSAKEVNSNQIVIQLFFYFKIIFDSLNVNKN